MNEEDDRFEGLSKDLKRLMKYRTKTLQQLEPIWNKKCSKCNIIKPARTHHCQICDKCVFHMDHHCRKFNYSVLYYQIQLGSITALAWKISDFLCFSFFTL